MTSILQLKKPYMTVFIKTPLPDLSSALLDPVGKNASDLLNIKIPFSPFQQGNLLTLFVARWNCT